jgi:hypothetical protein
MTRRHAQADLLSSANRVCLRELWQMRKVWLGPELHALDLTSRCLLALTRICNCTYNTYRVSTCLRTKGTQSQSLFASSASTPSRPSRRKGGGVERQTTVMQEYRVRGGVSLSALCHFRVPSRDFPSTRVTVRIQTCTPQQHSNFRETLQSMETPHLGSI